jgi:Uma2 family endonuclease
MASQLQWGAPVTYEDLLDMPDDGHRRELIDGHLIVTPAPVPLHQLCTFRLGVLLHAACPHGLVTLTAPVDWKLSDLTVVEPDVVVTSASDLSGAYLTQTPVLVVEVLSPSTRLIDLGSKRLLYARAGVEDYWIVDPAVPSLTALRLDGQDYSEVGNVAGDETHHAGTPFGVEVTPAELVAVDGS